MVIYLVAFLVSALATLLITRTQHLHGHVSADVDSRSFQKIHTHKTLRIGGLSIMVGILAATLFQQASSPFPSLEILLLFCSAIVFVIGLVEDITKRMSIRLRFICIMIVASMAAICLDAKVLRIDWIPLDHLLSFPGIALILGAFAIAGLTNAYNIIDGLNGLSSMVGILTLAGLAYVSHAVHDPELMRLSLMMACSVFGFFIWNYPKGKIFLGDGGAYLIGFWVAVISLLLITRHEAISPWFALLVNLYPVFETLFSIYRRVIHQRKSPGQADRLHLHNLIYEQVLTRGSAIHSNVTTSNAKTTPYLWLLAATAIVPAIIWRNSTPILVACCLTFSIFYLLIYKKMLHLSRQTI